MLSRLGSGRLVSYLRVSLGVEREMVGAGEAPLAVAAAEGFRTSVLAVVSGQLVGAGEAPLATFPRTLVRLLTCNHKHGIR